MIQRSEQPFLNNLARELWKTFDYSMDNVKGQYAAMLSMYQLITGRR